VLQNDVHDQTIDLKTNAFRPLPSGSFTKNELERISILLMVFSIIISFTIHIGFLLLTLTFLLLTHIYSVPPLRLKRFVVLSTLLAAASSLILLFYGYITFSPAQFLRTFPKELVVLFLTVFTLSLPIKDLKDIEGDKADGCYTLPVLFGPVIGKYIIASSVFISFLVAPVFLRDENLWIWSIILGGVAFWTIYVTPLQSHDKKRLPKLIRMTLTPRSVPLWIFVYVFFYGMAILANTF
jgi:4-hydroxybenzoate polyprenyltransferase